jgi:signal transduction histidine kinase
MAGLETQFDLLGTPRSLNSQIELTLYRVAQEGLTNARKYAQASLIKVTLCYDAEVVRLSICDDGQGSVDPTGGFGLLGLRERIQLVDGTVNIHTAPDQGFRLEVELPT